jgi:hypothetical protein
MEDIVAVRVELETGESRYFLTWGRIQDRVDSEILESLVLEYSRRCSLGAAPLRAQLCDSLQEASNEPYFYEGLFSFCSSPIPLDERYKNWRKERDLRMKEGKEIYFLGRPSCGSSPRFVASAAS